MSEYVKNWQGQQVFTLATEANIMAMNKAADVLIKDVKTHFTLCGSGRTVKGVWKPGASYGRRKHLASAPGEPPAIDMEILRVSMDTGKEVMVKGLNIIGRVGPDIEAIAAKAEAGTDVEYGLYLELGTSKMAPRPFLRPALKRTAGTVLKIFKDANK